MDGIASVEDHFSVFNYVIGWLTLTAWSLLRVRLQLEHVAQWDLPTVKKYACEQTDKNPTAYTVEAPSRIKRPVAVCRSIRAIGSALMGNSTPNQAADDQPAN